VRAMELTKNLDNCKSFSEILRDAGDTFADKVFLVDGSRRISFKEFDVLVNKCCGMMAGKGCKKGDVISLVMKNSADLLVLYFASLRLGCVINPLPFHLGAKEASEKLKFVGPKTVFSHSSLTKELSGSGLRAVTAQEDGKEMLAGLISDYPEDAMPQIDVDPDDTAFMYYSSGTTGSPKMIEYTVSSEIAVMASQLRAGFMKDIDCHLVFLPLGHTAAIRYSIFPCLLTGSKAVIYESFWKLRPRLWEAVKEEKAGFFEVVPSILIAILNTPYKDYDKKNVKSMKYIGCGSSFLPKKLQDDFESKFSIPAANLYGLSETGPTHFEDVFEKGRTRGNIGRPMDVVEAKIFLENGEEAKTWEQGEIGIKSPGLLNGYFKNKEQYASCFNMDGYFMTGDIGSVDDKGIFYYIDRKKDLIIKGGVNIVPSQIDEVLMSHEAVKEAATIGKPDMFLGETIKSYIVIKDGKDPDEGPLRARCREKLGDFKTPSFFEFVAELPKGPSGKVLKRILRERER